MKVYSGFRFETYGQLRETENCPVAGWKCMMVLRLEWSAERSQGLRFTACVMEPPVAWKMGMTTVDGNILQPGQQHLYVCVVARHLELSSVGAAV